MEPLKNCITCLKCKREFPMAGFSSVNGISELLANGCECKSKHLEVRNDMVEYKLPLNFITNWCPKCLKTRVIDVTTWDQISHIFANREFNTKSKLIEKINLDRPFYCKCILTI